MSDPNISEQDGGALKRRAPDHGQRHCLECGTSFPARRKASRFCTPQCRTNFLNRRNLRGAILYDLKMAERFERDDATAAGLLSVMNRLCADWRDDDNRRRAGRKSWGDWRGWLRDRPYLFAERLTRRWAGRAAFKQSKGKP